MSSDPDDHATALREAQVPEAARVPLRAYLDLLRAWNRRVNLTATETAPARVAVLVEPALRLLPLLRPGALLDIGAGNGSPGLVLAFLDPLRPVTLLEPRARRWAFLREAARLGGRPDVDVRRERHQDYRGPAAANVTVRGLRVSATALDRLIAPGGQALSSAPLPGAEPLLSGGARVFAYRPGVVPRET